MTSKTWIQQWQNFESPLTSARVRRKSTKCIHYQYLQNDRNSCLLLPVELTLLYQFSVIITFQSLFHFLKKHIKKSIMMSCIYTYWQLVLLLVCYHYTPLCMPQHGTYIWQIYHYMPLYATLTCGEWPLLAWSSSVKAAISVHINSIFEANRIMKWPTGNQMVTWPITSHDPEMSSRDTNTLKAQYLQNSWRCYLATIANYYLVCCEAVHSAILATPWLLVR